MKKFYLLQSLSTALVLFASSLVSNAARFYMDDEDYSVFLVSEFEAVDADESTPVSITAFNHVVYVADSECFTSKPILKRYSPSDGLRLADLSFQSPFNDDNKQFYVMRDDANHLVVLYKPFPVSISGTKYPSPIARLLVLNPDSGEVIYSYETPGYFFSEEWDGVVGHPSITGNILSGESSIYMPLYNPTRERIVVSRLNFMDGVKKSSGGLTLQYAIRDTPGGGNHFASVYNINKYISVIDLPGATPSMHTYFTSSNAIESSIYGIDPAACGFGAFEYKEHCFAIYPTNARTTEMALAIWPDLQSFSAQVEDEPVEQNPPYAFNRLVNVVEFGSNEVTEDDVNDPLNRRIVSVESSPEATFIHLLIPGRTLQTWRFGLTDDITDTGLVDISDSSSFTYSLKGKELSINVKNPDVAVYNLQGRVMPVKRIDANTINLANLAPGLYIVNTSHGSKLISLP